VQFSIEFGDLSGGGYWITLPMQRGKKTVIGSALKVTPATGGSRIELASAAQREPTVWLDIIEHGKFFCNRSN
jgi:hypothetical protein